MYTWRVTKPSLLTESVPKLHLRAKAYKNMNGKNFMILWSRTYYFQWKIKTMIRLKFVVLFQCPVVYDSSFLFLFMILLFFCIKGTFQVIMGVEIKQIDKFQPLHSSCVNTLGEDRKNDTFLLPIYIIFLEKKIQGVKKTKIYLFIYFWLIKTTKI